MLIPRLTLLLVPLLAAIAMAQTSRQATRPSPISIERVQKKNPEQRMVIARIDLTDPRLKFSVVCAGPDPDGEGPWETTLRQTSLVAAEHGFDLAVNASFFADKSLAGNGKPYLAGDWARATALVVADGKVLSPVRGGASLVIEKGNRMWTGTLRAVPKEAVTIVTGGAQLVFRGRDSTTPGDTLVRARTAAGLTKDGKTLILLTLDGRRPGWSIGMTSNELAVEMIAQGCYSAINLDGGGSATMVAKQHGGDQESKQKVLNTPSDGSTLPIPISLERPVAYVLGVTIVDPPATTRAVK